MRWPRRLHRPYGVHGVSLVLDVNVKYLDCNLRQGFLKSAWISRICGASIVYASAIPSLFAP